VKTTIDSSDLTTRIDVSSTRSSKVVMRLVAVRTFPAACVPPRQALRRRCCLRRHPLPPHRACTHTSTRRRNGYSLLHSAATAKHPVRDRFSETHFRSLTNDVTRSSRGSRRRICSRLPTLTLTRREALLLGVALLLRLLLLARCLQSEALATEKEANLSRPAASCWTASCCAASSRCLGHSNSSTSAAPAPSGLLSWRVLPRSVCSRPPPPVYLACISASSCSRCASVLAAMYTRWAAHGSEAPAQAPADTGSAPNLGFADTSRPPAPCGMNGDWRMTGVAGWRSTTPAVAETPGRCHARLRARPGPRSCPALE
jgi:hypothetical protein